MLSDPTAGAAPTPWEIDQMMSARSLAARCISRPVIASSSGVRTKPSVVSTAYTSAKWDRE